MVGWRILSVLALSWLACSGPARADPFAFELQVKTAKATKKGTPDIAAVGAKPKSRPVMNAKAGDEIAVKWTLSSAANKGVAKDVTVHLVVVKEEKVGQLA